MFLLMAFALGFLSPQASGGFELAPVRVFIYTHGSADGFVDAVSKRRTDSVLDLQKAVAKKKGFIVVDQQGQADVLLEVTISGPLAAGTESSTHRTTGILGPRLQTTTDTKTVDTLEAALRIPRSDYVLYFSDRNHTWGFMANRVANSLVEWVKTNRAKLPAAH